MTANSARGAVGAYGTGGGGVFGGTLNNCIVYYNKAAVGANHWELSYNLNYCCTTPQPTNGIANFTNAPLFLNQVAGDLRLQPNSPCINAGRNACALGSLDLDGNPRIVGGSVDVGAYEFQSPQSVISYAWLQRYGLSTDGSADLADPDEDGHNNWQEWRAWTNPTNSFSVLRLLTPLVDRVGVVVRWQSVSGQNYLLERSTGLGARPAFAQIASNIVGQTDRAAFADTNAAGAGPFLYRVAVQE